MESIENVKFGLVFFVSIVIFKTVIFCMCHRTLVDFIKTRVRNIPHPAEGIPSVGGWRVIRHFILSNRTGINYQRSIYQYVIVCI